MDNNNFDPIVICNEKGYKMAFEQVGVIPYCSEKSDSVELYALLKPIRKIGNIGTDEVVIFRVVFDDNKETTLVVVDDEETMNAVYDKYKELFMKKFRGGGQE